MGRILRKRIFFGFGGNFPPAYPSNNEGICSDNGEHAEINFSSMYVFVQYYWNLV